MTPIPQIMAVEIDRRAEDLFQQLRRDGFVITIDRECDAPAVASVLNVKTKTLRNWRDMGCGPPSRTIRGIAWYPLRDLAAHIIAKGRQGRPVLECAQQADAGSPPEVPP